MDHFIIGFPKCVSYWVCNTVWEINYKKDNFAASVALRPDQLKSIKKLRFKLESGYLVTRLVCK